MTNLTDECYLAIAKETLSCQDGIDLFENISRGAAAHVPDDVIPNRDKQLIANATVDEDATALIRNALINSIDPQKISVFLAAVKKREALRAKNIEAVHDRYKKEHKCVHCGLPTAPATPPGEKEEETTTPSYIS